MIDIGLSKMALIGAVALIVIDVFIDVSGMSVKSRRISPRCGTGTPTLPTSPRESGESGS